MSDALEAQSSLTDRYQTTVPEAVRKALGLSKRDRLTFSIRGNGEVVLSRTEAQYDPAIDAFLSFLEHDLCQNPQNIVPLSDGLKAKAQGLVESVVFDLDAPLPDEP